jgi:putative membrane protein
MRRTSPPITEEQEKEPMFKRMIPLGVFAVAIAGPAWAQTATTADPAALLSKANKMNYEEQEAAKVAYKKAGDNQALMTFANTLKGDHEANEEAVSALSRQKSIKLDTSTMDKEAMNKLNDLNGGDFNKAYLDQEVTDHKEALQTFKTAKGAFKSDPDMELYVQQTIPVLEAHLKMAENLRSHLAVSGAENPENNKSNTGGAGESSASSK